MRDGREKGAGQVGGEGVRNGIGKMGMKGRRRWIKNEKRGMREEQEDEDEKH